MKKNICLFFVFSLLSFNYVFSQVIVRGSVIDASTSEPLIGATIIYGKGMGAVTDIDGNYSFEINEGERNLTVSYVGYQQLSKRINVNKNSSVFNFRLKTILHRVEMKSNMSTCNLTSWLSYTKNNDCFLFFEKKLKLKTMITLGQDPIDGLQRA